MPDKRHACGNSCMRCWRNRLKHGNKETKRWLAKHGNAKIDDPVSRGRNTIEYFAQLRPELFRDDEKLPLQEFTAERIGECYVFSSSKKVVAFHHDTAILYWEPATEDYLRRQSYPEARQIIKQKGLPREGCTEAPSF